MITLLRVAEERMIALIKLFLTTHYQQIVGIFGLVGCGFGMSIAPSKIDWKKIGILLFTLFGMAYFFIRVKSGILFLQYAANGFQKLYDMADAGISFVFGDLAGSDGKLGFIFAFQVLPIIIFFSACVSVLYHFRVLQFFIRILGYVLKPFLGTGGPEALCAIANSFLGQTEAPLLVKSYLKRMNESEIFIVMISGMGTMSAGIIAVFGALGISIKNLLIASILAVPSTILFAHLIVPNAQPTRWTSKDKDENDGNKSWLSALSKGTQDGLFLALNIAAALIVIISLIHMIDEILAWGSSLYNARFGTHYHLSLHFLLGYLAYPFVWILQIPKHELGLAASLLGSKVAINEMIAYTKMVTSELSPYTVAVLTYALCGFSNFSSIGIQIGGIGSLEPSVKPILTRFGVRAVFAAALSGVLSAAVASFFL